MKYDANSKNTNKSNVYIHGFKVAAFYLMLLSTLGCASCDSSEVTNETEGQSVIFWNTDDYSEIESNFNISHIEAVDLLYKELSKNNKFTYSELKEHGIGYTHHVIVDDAYVFSIPHKLKGINLNGFRVNGFTGEVTSEYGPVLTPSQQQRQFGKVYDEFLRI